MPHATVNDVTIAYEVIGEGRPWAITPGGRFSKDFPGVRELAEELAEAGNQVLIYDRPNCGASDVCFTGASESAMQADTLAALLRHLDLTPAVISGGSGGARVSLLTASRHPDVAAGLAVWWISGGAFGLMSLGMHYCGQNLVKAWEDGMDAVAALPEWEEVISRNPSNRQRILDQDRGEFVKTMERWMLAYCPCGGELVPGLTTEDAAAVGVPDAGVPQRRERCVPHARDVGGGGVDAAPRTARRAAVGRSRVDRAVGRPPGERQAVRPVAASWRHSWSSGRARCSPDPRGGRILAACAAPSSPRTTTSSATASARSSSGRWCRTTSSGTSRASCRASCSRPQARRGSSGMAVPEEFGGGGVDDFRYNQVIGEELQYAGVAAAGLGLTLHTDICLPYFLSLGDRRAAEPLAARASRRAS